MESSQDRAVPQDELSQCEEGILYRFASRWTEALEGEHRWRLYWRQQKLMEGLLTPGGTVLELGVGNGFTSAYLRNHGFDVTTLDIDPRKHPDIVANIATWPFPQAYDAILAFEVFEHIPFDRFEAVFAKLAGAARERVFLSLPRNELVPLRLSLKIGARRREHTIECRCLEGRIRETHHFWELDHGRTTTERVERVFRDAGFTIERRTRHGKYRFYALRTPGAPRRRA